MSAWISRTTDVLNYYDGRDAAITLTLYVACLLSGFYPVKSNLHRSFQRIFKRLVDCRIVLRLYDDLGVLRNFFTYDLKPGVTARFSSTIFFEIMISCTGTQLARSLIEICLLSLLAWILSIGTCQLARSNEVARCRREALELLRQCSVVDGSVGFCSLVRSSFA